MGGAPTPGIGFGIGIERVLIACDAEGALPVPDERLDAFVVDFVGDPGTNGLVAALRDAGLRADRAYGGRSPKAQWKLADRARARYGVLVAPDEVARGVVAVKDMDAGTQIEVPRDQIA